MDSNRVHLPSEAVTASLVEV